MSARSTLIGLVILAVVPFAAAKNKVNDYRVERVSPDSIRS
jgi:hypothetical protein